MATPLLTTKLQIPRLRPERIMRPRLLEHLDAGLARPVTLVAAPAGFGKTTLVAEWVSGCRLPAAWLCLDEADNDPARFLAYLGAALQQIEDEAGQATLAALDAAQPQVPLGALLPLLVNEISAIPEDFILVLDDYHLIAAQPIHDALGFLIEHPPQPLHLVIATRADPPLPLARLRARGLLTELRQADLRVTPAEADEVLTRALGSGLPARQVAQLTERTEGWMAGLQMAALALHELPAGPGLPPPDAGAFIDAFSGTNRHILDYLVEEVLQHQTPQVRAFLLRTSILGRLSASLCEAVIGAVEDGSGMAPVASGQAMLEGLERANLFITPLDDRREWYRYHRLFADLLQQRLQAEAAPDLQADRPIDLAALHRRAAAWFAEREMLAEAIHHTLAAEDYDGAATLIEQAVPPAWRQGELAALLHWTDSLPESVLLAHPLLSLYTATGILIRTSSLARVESLVRAAAEHDPDGRLRGEVAVVQALVAMYQADIPRALSLAEQAVELLPNSSLFRGLATRTLSGLYLLAGDPAAAERLLEADVVASELSGDRLGLSASVRRLGSLALYRGELRKARTLYQRSLDLSRDARRELWPVAGRILTHLGELSLECNQLDDAADFLTQAVDLLDRFMPGWSATGHMVLARLRQALGDEAGARQAMETARQLARATETPMDDVYLEIQAARLALQQRDFASAERWAADWISGAAQRPASETPDVEGFIRSRMFHDMGQTTLARLHLARARPDQALAVLEPLLDKSDSPHASGNRIEFLALRALANRARGQTERALQDLGSALQLAEPEGLVRTFIDEGEPMRLLLREAVRAGVAVEYASRLIAILEASPQPGTTAVPRASVAVSPPASLVEPLTEREVEVLRLLQTSLTTPEIAYEMGIAPSTVRTFVKSVYGKLGVHRRIEAIDRARELDLLRA